MDLPFPPSALMQRVGAVADDREIDEYTEIGEVLAERITRLAGGADALTGARILDFGAGAGRVLRHFIGVADGLELWGCDIDRPSIAWAEEHLAPLRFVPNDETPPLPFADDHFDLVYAASVFTHLDRHWADWLVELHRVLRPGGLLIASVLGEAYWDWTAQQPAWAEADVGFEVTAPGQPWDAGGPVVFCAPWWVRERWGRGFALEAYEIEPSTIDRPSPGHDVVVARALDVPVTPGLFLEPGDDPREATSALAHARRLVERLRKAEREQHELIGRHRELTAMWEAATAATQDATAHAQAVDADRAALRELAELRDRALAEAQARLAGLEARTVPAPAGDGSTDSAAAHAGAEAPGDWLRLAAARARAVAGP